jgi:hypothetical protein
MHHSRHQGSRNGPGRPHAPRVVVATRADETRRANGELGLTVLIVIAYLALSGLALGGVLLYSRLQ